MHMCVGGKLQLSRNFARVDDAGCIAREDAAVAGVRKARL